MALLRELNEVAKARGEDLSVMALKWILDKEGVTSVLIGASRTQQILKNLQVLDSRPLSPEELEKIEVIADQIREIEKKHAA